MNNPANQRCCRFQYADSIAWCDVTIVNNDFIIMSAPNACAAGSARFFSMGIQKKSGTDDEYFGCIVADQGFRFQLSLTPEEVEEIHAAIPEIAFTDERAEVQP